MADTWKVAAVVVGTAHVTIYTTNAGVQTLKQGDTRIPAIIDFVVPIVDRGEIAEYVLPEAEKSAYEQFEKKTNGLIRFFRVAKSVANKIFNRGHDTTEAMLAEADRHEAAKKRVEYLQKEFDANPNEEYAKTALEEAKAVLVSAEPKVRKEWEGNLGAGIIPGIEMKPAANPSDTETVVAIVDGEIIPQAEDLRDQMAHAVEHGTTEAMTKFYERLAKVMKHRSHSAQDILRFKAKSDLPFTDDGCILAYKLLTSSGRPDDPEHATLKGISFDVHSRKVPQRVGSYVHVDEELVDRNRHNECSNGLHIARLGYLRGFGGDKCYLVKIRPEDIITVPHGDANKVRVCGYEILFELNPEEYRKAKSTKSFADNDDSKSLLAMAVRGEHQPILEFVKIGGQYGSKVVRTRNPDVKDWEAQMEKALQRGKPLTEAKASAVVLTNAVDSGPKYREEAKVDPKKMSVKPPVPAPTSGGNKEVATNLYKTMSNNKLTDAARREAAQKLKDFKKVKKVSWLALGLTGNIADEIQEILDLTEAPKAQPTKVDAVVAAKKVSKITEKPKAAPVKETKPSPMAYPEVIGSNAEKAVILWGVMDMVGYDAEQRKLAATELRALKKRAKVSWARLGLNDTKTEDKLKTILGN